MAAQTASFFLLFPKSGAVFTYYRALHKVRPAEGDSRGQREKLADFRSPRLTLAHADLSGFSLFEEAQYRGVLAAERVLRTLGVRFVSSLGAA